MTNRQLEIIEAAGKILSTTGVCGLTIKKLSKEMHFSESAIYRHFKSKEEIIIALLEYLAEKMDINDAKAISESNGPEENFKILFKSQFALFSAHPYFVVSTFSVGLMEKSERINEAILKIMMTKMKYLMPIIMTGQQQGVFTNSILAEDMVNVVMGTLRFQMFKWKVANFEFDIVRSGDNVIHTLLTLIKTK